MARSALHAILIALVRGLIGTAIAALMIGLVAAKFGRVPQVGAPGHYKVAPGIRAHPEDWPATFIFSTDGSELCTATAVGASVVLTAAHCIAGKDGTVGHAVAAQIWRPDVDGERLAVRCDAPAGYRYVEHQVDPDDTALCRLADGAHFSGFAALSNMPANLVMQIYAGGSPWYEKLAPAGDQTVARDDEITLLGYGCTTHYGSDSSVLSYNKARITTTLRSNVVYIADNSGGGGTVCAGDSGGAAYYGMTSDGPVRRVFAVNSAFAAADSYLAPVTTPGFVAWAKQWAKGDQICGVTEDAIGCKP